MWLPLECLSCREGDVFGGKSATDFRVNRFIIGALESGLGIWLINFLYWHFPLSPCCLEEIPLLLGSSSATG